MKVTHLATTDGGLCHNPSKVTTARLADVSCTRCTSALTRTVDAETTALFERQRAAKRDAALRQTGLEDIWAHVLRDTDDNASGQMMRDIFTSLALWIAETGYTATAEPIAA